MSDVISKESIGRRESLPAIVDEESEPTDANEVLFWLNSGQADDMSAEQKEKFVKLKDVKRRGQEALNGGDSTEVMSALAAETAACATLGEGRSELANRAAQFAMMAAAEVVCGKTTPRTDAEAKQSPEWDSEWKPSLVKEVEALRKMGTFSPVRHSEMKAMNKRTKKLKVVRKIKVTKDGEIEKFKSRMVIQGFSLTPEDEFFESYSSVVAASNTRMLLYVAAQTGEDLSSADVGNAYL